MRDLVILVADSNMEFAIRGLLTRHQSIGCRSIMAEIIRHPQRDPGVWRNAEYVLRVYVRDHQYAMVLLDHEGSGQEGTEPAELETRIEQRLSSNGWDRRCRAIVIAPELESWVWSTSKKVDEILGWAGDDPDLREWLRQQGYLDEHEVKPGRPKEALQAVLKTVQLPRSSSLYQHLAEQVSFRQCTDPAFNRFVETLQGWFPPRT